MYYEYDVDIWSSEGHRYLPAITDSDGDFAHTVYMLPLVHIVQGPRAEKYHEDNRRDIWGLLLAASNKKKGEYRRVGVFGYSGLGCQDSGALPRFEKALNEFGATVAESACAEILPEPKYPLQRYIITII